MDFSVQLEGIGQLEHSSALIKARAKTEIEKALFASGKKVEGDAKKSILSGNKSGRTYTRRSVTHRASAPGEAPASDTGRLANSINTRLNQFSGGLEAFVYVPDSTVKYAKFLEFGTQKIAPRPFFFRALEQNKQWIADRLREAMRRALEGK